MKKLAIVLAIGLTSVSTYALGWSDFFTVKRLVVNETDSEIAREIEALLSREPSAIEIGEPIARVDKREITARLRELIWVNQVSIDRKVFAGEVIITTTSREAIARISPNNSAPMELATNHIDFLGSDLNLFSIPAAQVDRAARSGESDWRKLPKLSLGNSDLSLREDVASLLEFLNGIGVETKEVIARDSESLVSSVQMEGRDLDISWGNVKDLPLKEQVLMRILELKENKRVEKIDLSSPLSPVVR
jgi:hypothetical protein